MLAKKAHQLPAYATAVRETEAWALEALPAAREAGPELERAALHGLGWARAMRGLPIDDVCERFRACSDAAAHITDSPEPVEGLRLLWRGEIEPARTILTNLLTESDVRGEEVSYALQRLNLCDLELRAGNWDAAERLLDEWQSADRQLLIEETYLRSRALLAVGRGFPQQAEPLAARSLAGAEPRGYYWQVNEAQRALGVGALLAHQPESAAENLGAVWERTQREGVDEPGAFPVAPDLVEALVALDRLDEARAVTARLRDLAEAQEHPWALAGAKRSGALVSLAGEYDDEGAADLQEAADAYGELGLRFDRARTCSASAGPSGAYGSGAPRARSLQSAATAFDEMGSPGWADAGAVGAGSTRRSPPTGSWRADSHGAAGRWTCGRRAREQGDRERPVHHGPHR